MNKYQEVLVNYFKAKKEFENEMYNSMELLEELVDKATPRKVTSEMLWVNIYEYNCPVCEEKVDKTDYYCSHCGQAIDWSDDASNT